MDETFAPLSSYRILISYLPFPPLLALASVILPGHQFEVSERLPDKTCHTDTRMPTAGGWSAVVGVGEEGFGGTDGVISGFDTDA